MGLNVAWRKKERKKEKRKTERKKDEKRKLNGHSVRHSVSKAVTLWQCGTEHITAAEAEFVDLIESDLSSRLAVCCLLSVTFPNTTAYFFCVPQQWQTWRQGKEAGLHTLSRVHQSNGAVLHYWPSFKAVWRLYENIVLEWISRRYWQTGE